MKILWWVFKEICITKYFKNTFFISHSPMATLICITQVLDFKYTCTRSVLSQQDCNLLLYITTPYVIQFYIVSLATCTGRSMYRPGHLEEMKYRIDTPFLQKKHLIIICQRKKTCALVNRRRKSSIDVRFMFSAALGNR